MDFGLILDLIGYGLGEGKDLLFSDQGSKVVVFMIAWDMRRQVVKLTTALTTLEQKHALRLTRIETHVGIQQTPQEGQ